MKQAARSRRRPWDPRDARQYLTLINRQRCIAVVFNRETFYCFTLRHIREG